jgi:hypothetical protein
MISLLKIGFYQEKYMTSNSAPNHEYTIPTIVIKHQREEGLVYLLHSKIKNRS